MRSDYKSIFPFAFMVFIAIPSAANAYVGPGAGLSAIGSLLAVIGMAVFGIAGLIWYPFKRLMNRLKRKDNEETRN